jgi:hypothetical protein
LSLSRGGNGAVEAGATAVDIAAGLEQHTTMKKIVCLSDGDNGGGGDDDYFDCFCGGDQMGWN